jgi:hypothetical protein
MGFEGSQDKEQTMKRWRKAGVALCIGATLALGGTPIFGLQASSPAVVLADDTQGECPSCNGNQSGKGRSFKASATSYATNRTNNDVGAERTSSWWSTYSKWFNYYYRKFAAPYLP